MPTYYSSSLQVTCMMLAHCETHNNYLLQVTYLHITYYIFEYYKLHITNYIFIIIIPNVLNFTISLSLPI